MSVTLQEIISGSAQVPVFVRLAAQVPSLPYILSQIVECTFPGYSRAPLDVSAQGATVNNWGYLSGTGTFTLLAPSETARVEAVYLTAMADGVDYLLSVALITEEVWRTIRRGQTTFSIEVGGSLTM